MTPETDDEKTTRACSFLAFFRFFFNLNKNSELFYV